MLRDQTEAESFTDLVRDIEPALRRGLTAGVGSQVGRDATAEALTYGWQHWDRIKDMTNPTGYLFRVGQNKARRLTRRPGRLGRVEIAYSEPWAEAHFDSAWESLSRIHPREPPGANVDLGGTPPLASTQAAKSS